MPASINYHDFVAEVEPSSNYFKPKRGASVKKIQECLLESKDRDASVPHEGQQRLPALRLSLASAFCFFFFPLCFLFFSVLLCIYFLSIGCWHCLYGFGMTFCLALFFPGGPAEPISAPNFPFTVWTVKMDLGPSICFLCLLVSCYALSVEGARETLQEGQSFISWFSSACLATS